MSNQSTNRFVYFINPNDLLSDEVDYELKLRYLPVDGSLQEKRQILKKALLNEIKKPRQLVSKKSLNQEYPIVLQKLQDLQHTLETGSLEPKHISRLRHYRARIYRINAITREQQRVRTELIASVEGLLDRYGNPEDRRTNFPPSNVRLHFSSDRRQESIERMEQDPTLNFPELPGDNGDTEEQQDLLDIAAGPITQRTSFEDWASSTTVPSNQRAEGQQGPIANRLYLRNQQERTNSPAMLGEELKTEINRMIQETIATQMSEMMAQLRVTVQQLQQPQHRSQTPPRARQLQRTAEVQDLLANAPPPSRNTNTNQRNTIQPNDIHSIEDQTRVIQPINQTQNDWRLSPPLPPPPSSPPRVERQMAGQYPRLQNQPIQQQHVPPMVERSSSWGPRRYANSETSQGPNVDDPRTPSPYRHYAEQRYRHTVPISKWRINFGGDSRGPTVTQFINRVEILARNNNVTDGELLSQANFLFRENSEAEEWYYTFCHKFTSWTNFKYQLRLRFEQPNKDGVIERQILDRRQYPNETFNAFVGAIEKLAQQLTKPMTESRKLEILMSNMRNSYKPFLTFYNIQRIDELVMVCHGLDKSMYHNYTSVIRNRQQQVNCVEEVEEEEFYESEEAEAELNAISRHAPKKMVEKPKEMPIHRQTGAIPKVVNEDQNNILCWNCRQFGHFWRSCEKSKKVFCHFCGYMNTITSKCPNNHMFENQLEKNEPAERS